MFGYVKPDKDNLLVKEEALYKATYCGLCSVIKKEISRILPLKLSYDFVFMVMLRSILSEEKSDVSRGRCKYNPLKKAVYAIPRKASLFTARAALILTVLKLEDDINDKDSYFIKRIFSRILYLHFSKKMKRLLKKETALSPLVDKIRLELDSLGQLERERSDNWEAACEMFGNVLSEIAAFSLDEDSALIAREIGRSVGRFIYLADAVDDLKSDEKSGSYNPLLAKYGSLKSVKKNFKAIDVSVAMYAKRAQSALNLTEPHDYTPVVNNVISMGMGKEFYRLTLKNGE